LRLIVHAPATTSNLGSGFDTLGMALDMWNIYEVEESERNEFIVDGRYKEELESEEPDLFFFKRVENLSESFGITLPKIKVFVRVEIPPKRGLGSSATVALAVVEILEKFGGLNLREDEKIRFLVDLEGHPDNVVPAFLGGLMIVSCENDKIMYHRIPFPKKWKMVFFIPNFKISTEMARKILPNSYRREAVVSQMRRLGFLISGFYEENEELVRFGMEDFIHQKYRLKLEKRMLDLFNHVRKFNPISSFVSGSGSTIATIFPKNVTVPKIPGVEKVETGISDGVKVEVKQRQ